MCSSTGLHYSHQRHHIHDCRALPSSAASHTSFWLHFHQQRYHINIVRHHQTSLCEGLFVCLFLHYSQQGHHIPSILALYNYCHQRHHKLLFICIRVKRARHHIHHFLALPSSEISHILFCLHYHHQKYHTFHFACITIIRDITHFILLALPSSEKSHISFCLHYHHQRYHIHHFLVLPLAELVHTFCLHYCQQSMTFLVFLHYRHQRHHVYLLFFCITVKRDITFIIFLHYHQQRYHHTLRFTRLTIIRGITYFILLSSVSLPSSKNSQVSFSYFAISRDTAHFITSFGKRRLPKEVMFLVALVCLFFSQFFCLFVCRQHYSKKLKTDWDEILWGGPG